MKQDLAERYAYFENYFKDQCRIAIARLRTNASAGADQLAAFTHNYKQAQYWYRLRKDLVDNYEYITYTHSGYEAMSEARKRAKQTTS